MAESATPAGESYDIFIVHCGEDRTKAQQINEALIKKGKKTFAYYKEGVLLTPGKPVFDNILHAVECSKKVLVLLTKAALESQWVSFEILMVLEKSNRENVMCVRLVFEGVSDENKKSFMTRVLNLIPSVELDFIKEDWMEILVDSIDKEVKMTDEVLPGGNVAHGLVFHHYIGYLVYVLPVTEERVKISEYYNQGKFSKTNFIIIPESCEVHKLEGQFDDILIEKMGTSIEVDVTHGDQKLTYNMIVYKVTKHGINEVYYFTGDIPFILGTMLKMKKQEFVDIDVHLQSVRFSKTLQELVERRSSKHECKGKAHIIAYDDKKTSLAPLIWEALVEEFQREPPKHEYTAIATITHCADLENDQEAADEVHEFLTTNNVKIGNGNCGKNHLGEKDNLRWKIFIFSEDSIKDDEMTHYFNAALEDSLSSELAQVICVLVKGSDFRKIPDCFRWTTMLKQSDPEYLETLLNSLQDKDTSFTSAMWEALVEEFQLKPQKGEQRDVRQTKEKFEHKDAVTATITHCADLETDQEAADEVQEFLKTKNVKFGKGNGGKYHLSEMDESRWKIFILSEDSIKNDQMIFYFNTALEESISTDSVQVIPVLAKGSDLSKLPYHFRWTTLLKQSEPEYLEKLWNSMQEEEKMTDYLPAGLLYEGLAYAFLLNYMCFNFINKTPSGRDFNERFIDALTKYCKDEQCICVPKVFVLVPKSCTVPSPGTQFEGEVYLGSLEPIVLGPRKYFLQFYQLTMSNGQKVSYAREYATSVITLHSMAHDIPFSGLDKFEMKRQARQFAEFSNIIMQIDEFNKEVDKISEKCSIVYFDDEVDTGNDAVIAALEGELQKNIMVGNILKV